MDFTFMKLEIVLLEIIVSHLLLQNLITIQVRVEHPMHAGDLPPILSANGIGILSTFTNRFTVEEVIGKSFIIHSGYDDFTSQPAGNAGTRWACGVIDYY